MERRLLAIERGISLLSGLAHFVLFFAWASTLDMDPGTRTSLKLSEFEIFLLLVLLYDFAWWLMSSGHRFPKLTLWTVINCATAMGCLVIHTVFTEVLKQSHWKTIECVVFVPVIIVSLIDISEIFTQQEFFRNWFHGL